MDQKSLDGSVDPIFDDARLDHMTSSSMDTLIELDLATPYDDYDSAGEFHVHESNLQAPLYDMIEKSQSELSDGLITLPSSNSSSQNDQRIRFSEMSTETAFCPMDLISSSSTNVDLDLPNLEILTDAFNNEWTRPGPTNNPRLMSAKVHLDRRQSAQDIRINHNTIRKPRIRTHKTKLRKALSPLEKMLRSDGTLSAQFRQKTIILLSQMELLIEEEELRRNMRFQTPSAQSSTSSSTTFTIDNILSQQSMSSSEPLDSGYRTEDTGEVSTTPRPLTFDAHEATWLGENAASLQIGFKPLYECTKESCEYSTHSEVDWRRHEQGEKHWPQERFMCLQCPATVRDPFGNRICPFCFDATLSFDSLGQIQAHFLQCGVAKDKGKTFGRRDHFYKHLRDQHRISNTSTHAEDWVYAVNSNWPRPCGFCETIFLTWEQRMDHIAQHYQAGAKVKNWVFENSRPKDFRFRRSDLSSKRNNRDDEDDFDNCNKRLVLPGNGWPATGTYIGSGNPGSSSNYWNTSPNSRHEFRSKHHFPINDGDAGGSYRNAPVNSGSINQHCHPNLLLERYLNDTEAVKSVTGLLRTGQNHPGKTSKPTLSRYVIRNHRLLLHKGGIPYIVPLVGFPTTEKTRAAWGYIASHYEYLHRGIFWVESKMDFGVKESLWDIANQIIKDNRVDNMVAAAHLQHWLKKRLLCKSLVALHILLPDIQHDATQKPAPNTSSIETPPSIASRQSEGAQAVQPITLSQSPPRFIDGAIHRRVPWSQAEDAYLVQLVHTQGALNWVRIAQLIGSRSPKQCRERYHQNLKPSLNHEPITPEEGLEIERLVGQMGKRWAEIARRLHGRSDNAVKNWWNGSMNRRRRLVSRRSSDKSSRFFDDTVTTLSSATTKSFNTYEDKSLGSDNGLHSPLLSHSAASSWFEMNPIERLRYLYLDNAEVSKDLLFSTARDKSPIPSAVLRSASDASTVSSQSIRSDNNNSFDGRDSLLSAATSVSGTVPPWHPPTLNQQITTMPFDYGYFLPCEFFFTGCNLRFDPSEFEAWISHSVSHLGVSFPRKAICTLCDDDEAVFESDDDPFMNWRARMLHIGEHLQDFPPYEHMRPDYWVIEHMWENRVISAEDYTCAKKHTDRPHLAHTYSLNYETPAMLAKKEKVVQQPHDLGKKRRMERESRQRGNHKSSHSHRNRNNLSSNIG